MIRNSDFTPYRPSTGEKWDKRWWRFGWLVDRGLWAAWIAALFR